MAKPLHARTCIYTEREGWNQFPSWSVFNFYSFEDFSLPRLDSKLNSLYMCIYSPLYCTPLEVNPNDFQEDYPVSVLIIQNYYIHIKQVKAINMESIAVLRL